MIGLTALDTTRLDASALQQSLARVPLGASPFAALLESAEQSLSVAGSQHPAAELTAAQLPDPAGDDDDPADAMAIEPEVPRAMPPTPPSDVRPQAELPGVVALNPAPANLPSPVRVTETARTAIAPDVAVSPAAERPPTTVVPQVKSSPPARSLPDPVASQSAEAPGQPENGAVRQESHASEAAIDDSGDGFAAPQASPPSIQTGLGPPQAIDRAQPSVVIDGRQSLPEPSALRDTVVRDTLRAAADLDVMAIEIGAAEVMVARGSFRIATEHLGVLGIGIAPRSDGMAVQIAASDPDRAAFISAAQPQLIDELRSQGIRLSGSGEATAQNHNPSSDRGRPQWLPTDVMPPDADVETREPPAERHYRLA